MAGIITTYKRLESRSARSKLRRGRTPHWRALEEGKVSRVHIGYQCHEGAPAGRWLLRRYLARHRYSVETLGFADDDRTVPADGVQTLTFEQAVAKARSKVAVTPQAQQGPLTVRQAWQRYVEAKEDESKNFRDMNGRAKVYILPALGDLVVAELTTEILRKWHANMARSPAQLRPGKGRPKYKPAPKSDEEIRARKVSANRMLTSLRAALNHAYDEGLIKHRDAWDRRLKVFKSVNTARLQYLSVEQAQRLINAADPGFRPLLQAALETGARYGELIRLRVQDFNTDADTVAVRRAKSGKPRHIYLTPKGAAFFRQHCAGRAGSELMFRRGDGAAWNKGNQERLMREACTRANITPPVGFHSARHTWASLAIMNGVPLTVVAENLGHVDTRMVQAHYGHMEDSFIRSAIRRGAPDYGIATGSTVVPLHHTSTR